jgi:hypothetical protein
MRKLAAVAFPALALAVVLPATALGETAPAGSLQGLKTVTGSFTVPDGWTQSRGALAGTPVLGQYQKAYALPSGDLCLMSAATSWTGVAPSLKVDYSKGHLKIPVPNALSGFKPIASTTSAGSTSIYLGAFRSVKPYDARITWSNSYATIPTGGLGSKIKNARSVLVLTELWVWMSEAARAKPGQSAACRTIAATTGVDAVRGLLASFKLS